MEKHCKTQEVAEMNSTERRMSDAAISSKHCVPHGIFFYKAVFHIIQSRIITIVTILLQYPKD